MKPVDGVRIHIGMAMILRVHLIFILFFACSAMALTGNAAEGVRGAQTSLQCTVVDAPSVPHADQSIGRTRFVLRSEPHGEIRSIKELEGRWFCFGYNAKTHAYVIGGIYQVGAFLPMASIQYPAEDGSSFKPSAFDRSGYIALSAVTSPAGRYIVFIGGRNTSDGLYVLDTERDLVRKLGHAPSPPPNQSLVDICQSEPFVWGGCWADGYVEMDAGILRFATETALEVSYGRDGPSCRAKQRRVRRFRLDG